MTHAEFGAQLLHLPDIFADKFFTIPDYQRGYAWEAKQVKELLKDVEHLMGDGAALCHYTGTLVLSRPQGVPADEFHVVDGQQRLTTLFIFLQQLSQRLPQSEQAVFCAQYLWRGARGSERLVLRLNADTRRFFENILFGDESAEVSLESHQRLLDARNLIGKWLDTKLNEGVALNDVCNVLHKRLGFLVYAPTEDGRCCTNQL